jgi:hypothetical protein
MDSSWCRGHHGTLMVWLCDVINIVTQVDPVIFDGIAWFHQNKHFYVAKDKLFLEKSLGTHFWQFSFPRVRLIVL